MLDTTERLDLNVAAPRTEPTDRSRWIALLVLCTGMLMIVLDGIKVSVSMQV